MINTAHKKGSEIMANNDYMLINYQHTKKLCENLFIAYGFSSKEADIITEILLRADLYGIESHGIQRLIRYHHALLDGEVDISAICETLHETPVSATINAHKSMGQLAGQKAMETAIKKAKSTGIGMVAMQGSNHYGIAGYYALMAAEQDLLGVCMTNSEAIMVPTFGKKAMLGTNPIALAMPANPSVFLFDAATAVVPRGKLEVYNKQSKPIPNGWATDENGTSSSDANLVLHNIINKLGGGIAPLGGTEESTGSHKGYGFGIICELFTSIMSGGLTSNNCVTKEINTISHGFWAIDYGIFGNKNEIKRNFSEFLTELRQTPKASGHDRIFIHGEKEFESAEQKKAVGIPVNEKTFNEIVLISKHCNIDHSNYIQATFEV